MFSKYSIAALLIGISHSVAEAKPLEGAYITQFAGSVKIDGKSIQGPTQVVASSVIETGAESNATLLVEGNSVVHLGPETKMKVSELRGSSDTTLDLEAGKTRALIRSGEQGRQFRIRSRSATMGVRGTQIYLDQPKDITQPATFATLEGQADVQLASTGQTVPVGENQSISAAAPAAAPAAPEAPAPAPAAAPPPPPPAVASLSGGAVTEMTNQTVPPPPPPRMLQEVQSQIPKAAPTVPNSSAPAPNSSAPPSTPPPPPPLPAPSMGPGAGMPGMPMLDPVLNSPVNQALDRVRVKVIVH